MGEHADLTDKVDFEEGGDVTETNDTQLTQDHTLTEHNLIALQEETTTEPLRSPNRNHQPPFWRIDFQL